MREMENFGVRFCFDDEDHLAALGNIFEALKHDKQAESPRRFELWLPLVPMAVQKNFDWPEGSELAKVAELRATRIMVIDDPENQIGARWDFFSIVDAVRSAEYEVLGLCRVDEVTAELQINPDCYPYGGIGPLIALAEGFGFRIVGWNEYGKYHSADAIFEQLFEPPSNPSSSRSWWKFWS